MAEVNGIISELSNMDSNRNVTFDNEHLQQIDIKVPRKISFNKDTNQIRIENTKTEAQTLSDVDLLLASTLIKDARSGRNLNFKTDEKSIRAYVLYDHWALQLLLHISVWGNMLLALFEPPAVEGLSMPYWGSMIIEIAFLGYFAFHFFHHMYFDSRGLFWKDSKNITVFVTILLTVVDMICYVIWVNVDSGGEESAVRWSRILRPLFLINFPEGRQIRKAFRNIRRTLPDIATVLILFLLSIALFALMALKLFQKRNFTYPDGKQYFRNYFDSYWDLYVLVTTANNPDVMMPAYDNESWFAVFFIIYTIINLYIFMSIVLAVVYNNYKKHLKNEVRASVYLKRKLLRQAFDIVKIFHQDRYVLTKDRWHALMAKALPDKSTTQIDILLYVLDENGDQMIEKKEFLSVADLLNVPLSEVKERMTFLEAKFPSVYMSAPSEMIKVVVRNRYFRYFFDFAILVNAVCIGLSLDEAEWFFLSIFSLEIILKLYTYGPQKFFRSVWNSFDFLVIAAALIATIVELISGSSAEEQERTLDFILVLRVLRLVRLMSIIPKFQIILTTIVNIGPAIATYGGVIFVIYYIYAIIGMEAFSGKIRYFGYTDLNSTTTFCGNPKLNGSEFFIKRYCKNNFNDLVKSLVLLFELMVVNQWHVLSNGFVLVTNKAARLYFITFHMIAVIILLNIFTAFVLEVFLLEYNLTTSEMEVAIEKKIKDLGLTKGGNPVGRRKTLDKIELVDNEIDETGKESEETTSGKDSPDTDLPPGAQDAKLGIRFRVKRKSTKKIEVVLQQMFEGEISPTDEGPDADLENYDFQREVKPTLDSVA